MFSKCDNCKKLRGWQSDYYKLLEKTQLMDRLNLVLKKQVYELMEQAKAAHQEGFDEGVEMAKETPHNPMRDESRD